MPRTLQFKRLGASTLANTIGANGELIINTTNKTITVHDGTTPGGFATLNSITDNNIDQFARNTANNAINNVVSILGVNNVQNTNITNATNLAQAAFNRANTGGGGNANTGNVTFDNQTIIGTGDIYGGGGLYLALGPEAVSNSMYFRVRGGDDPTHLHFDTGDNNTYDQYFGDDGKYLKLEAGSDGNVKIGTAFSNEWVFTNDGVFYPADDIRVGDSGGRYIQNCATGTTSMRWYNVGIEEESQLIRVYTGDALTEDEIERAQISADWTSANQSGITITSFDNDIVRDYTWAFQGDGRYRLPGVEGSNYTIGETMGGLEISSGYDVVLTSNNTGETANSWRFAFDGNIYFPDGSVQTTAYIGGALTGNISIASTNSAINFVANSSGDGYGFSTLQLVPDTNASLDQYIIIDPTAPSHIHIRAGGTQDASQAQLFLGGEKNYVRVTDYQGLRLQNEYTSDNYNYYVENSQYVSGTWFEESGNYFVQFTTDDPQMIDDLNDFATNNILNEILLYWDPGTGVISNTMISVAGYWQGIGNVYTAQVNSTLPANNTVLTAIEFHLFTTQTNFIRLENNDFTVDVKDDVRINGRDTFSLRNWSTDEPISIITDYDNYGYTWEFLSNGNLRLPYNGDIKNSDGYSVIKSIPQNRQNSLSDYTLVLSDAGKHIYKDDGDGYGVVVPTDASVNFEIGTAITIVSGSSSTYIFCADSETTALWGAGYNTTSQNFYIPANSMATLLKVEANKWILSGAGLAID